MLNSISQISKYSPHVTLITYLHIPWKLYTGATVITRLSRKSINSTVLSFLLHYTVIEHRHKDAHCIHLNTWISFIYIYLKKNGVVVRNWCFKYWVKKEGINYVMNHTNLPPTDKQIPGWFNKRNLSASPGTKTGTE